MPRQHHQHAFACLDGHVTVSWAQGPSPFLSGIDAIVFGMAQKAVKDATFTLMSRVQSFLKQHRERDAAAGRHCKQKSYCLTHKRLCSLWTLVRTEVRGYFKGLRSYPTVLFLVGWTIVLMPHVVPNSASKLSFQTQPPNAAFQRQLPKLSFLALLR